MAFEILQDLGPAYFSGLMLQSSPCSPLSIHCPANSSVSPLPWDLLLPLPGMLLIFRHHLSSESTLTTYMKKVPPPLFSITAFNLFRKPITACSDLIHLLFTCLFFPPESYVHKGKIIANTCFVPSTVLSALYMQA